MSVLNGTTDFAHAQVGLFGDWLSRHTFGKFVKWQPDADGEYVTVAVERDGKIRIPSGASLNQYILVQVLRLVLRGSERF